MALDLGRGPVHFSLWTAPCCAVGAVVSQSLQSVLGEGQVPAGAECAAWGPLGTTGLRAESRQGRAQGPGGYVVMGAKDTVLKGPQSKRDTCKPS